MVLVHCTWILFVCFIYNAGRFPRQNEVNVSFSRAALDRWPLCCGKALSESENERKSEYLPSRLVDQICTVTVVKRLLKEHH
jgi:hypothetical protein